MTVKPALPIATAEFFSGIGLMAAALKSRGFEVVWANDIEPAKCDLYLANRPHISSKLVLGDVRAVCGDKLPRVDLATASFPCIDLSLAGNRRGLAGDHSGMFWEFARVLDQMGDTRPRAVLIENVPGFATSSGGNDVRVALERMASLGYSSDVITINARHFVPQSRRRMFIVGVRGDLPKDAHLGVPPLSEVRPQWVRDIHAANDDLPMHYLDMPTLPDGPRDLGEVIEQIDSADNRWWDKRRTEAFVASLQPLHRLRLKDLKADESVSWRTAYRRTRHGVATWEIRADAIAGCLRTTGGGSSKQALVQAGGGQLRLRWMTPAEYARLMGADGYKTSARTDNQALFGFGDAVVVDVIAWIADHYLLPTLWPNRST